MHDNNYHIFFNLKNLISEILKYFRSDISKAQWFELCLSRKKQIYTCMHYAIFDCIRVQRFYLTAWRLEFAQRGSTLVNERSTFFYEVFKYYLILLKNPQTNSIADTNLFSIRWAKCSSYFGKGLTRFQIKLPVRLYLTVTYSSDI